jgi:5'-nucleotidase
MRNAGRLIGAASIALVLLAGCSSSSDKADGGGATTTVAPEPIKILVTNDDGYSADGIDAVVEGLKTIPNVEITVVAPATNQSGTGGSTTTGALTVTDVTTKSGYKAKAVAGFPADTIIWAIDVSGTVGAARAAVSRGIPALAASQGLGDPTNFAAGQKQVLAWLESNMAGIEAGTLSTATVPNLNIPTCPTGDVRGQIEVPVATSADGYNDPPNCTSTATNPTDDIQAFLIGYAPVSQLSVKPAAG